MRKLAPPVPLENRKRAFPLGLVIYAGEGIAVGEGLAVLGWGLESLRINFC